MIARRLCIATSVALVFAATAVGQVPEYARQPVPFDPGRADRPLNLGIGGPDDPQIDIALECFADTRVTRFTANPPVVQPFESTTLLWDVDIPAGCPVSLSIAGQQVARTGTLEVTPLHVDSRFGLVGSMLGVRGTLASAQVTVDQATCRMQGIPQNLVAPGIVEAIDTFDEEEDDFAQIEDPQIQIQSNGLFIHMVVKTDVTLFPDATVTLDLGLRFTVRDGVINPRYVLFRPQADTALPDDWVESRFFERAGSILAEFKSGFNAAITQIINDDERLFDLTTEPFALQAVICEIEPLPAPRLTVRLRVMPEDDPGRFNLRIDDIMHASNQGDGGTTGVREVSEGTHTVSQTVAGQTRLADYRTFIGGACSADGRVTVAPGDAKICFITNIAQESPGQCLDDCRAERDQCMADPATPPPVCVAIFNACKATCN